MVRDCRVHQILEGTNEIIRYYIKNCWKETNMEDINIKKINSTILITLLRKGPKCFEFKYGKRNFKNIEFGIKIMIFGNNNSRAGEKSFCAGGDMSEFIFKE